MQQKRFGVRLKENNITKKCIATTGARKKNYAIRCSRNLIVCCCFYFFLSKRITSTKNDKCTHVNTRRIIISRFHWCNRCRRVQFVSFFFIIIIIVIIFHLNFFPSQSVNAIQSRGECRECTKKPSSLLKRSLKSMCNASGKKNCENYFCCRNLIFVHSSLVRAAVIWCWLLLLFGVGKYAKAICISKLHDKEANCAQIEKSIQNCECKNSRVHFTRARTMNERYKKRGDRRTNSCKVAWKLSLHKITLMSNVLAW